MTHRAIAADGDYVQPTVTTYIGCWRRYGHLGLNDRPGFVEAFQRVGSPGYEPAIDAIAEREGVGYSTAERSHRPEIKAIAAQLTDLPPAEKVALARELAQDRDFRLGSDVERADRGARIRESYGASPAAPGAGLGSGGVRGDQHDLRRGHRSS